ncbi:transposase [Yoonia sp. R2-816]
MDYYVGLDVSLRTVAVCVIDTDGKLIFERSVACEIEDIAHCLRDLSKPVMQIGFEAGAMSQHLFFGLRLPSRVDQGSFDERVRPLIEADPDLSHALLPLLDARAVLYRTYRELDRRVKQTASHDETCLRFMAIPGVGPIAALTFRAAVDDPSRFTSSRTVAAHFGLTPRRYQSGEMDNPGRISKAGDPDVRATLYSAANAMMMRSVASSEIKSWGLRLM